MIDLAGKIFGSFLVLSEGERRLYKGQPIRRHWTCLCNKCGNTKDIFQGSLLYGKSVSCGCWRSEYTRDKNKRNRDSKLERGYSGLNKIYKTYIKHAKNRNLEFNLSLDAFKIITSENCYYCDEKPKQISRINTNHSSAKNIEHTTYVYNGIDRVNNTDGYIDGNCVPCCGMCNRAKRNYPINDFINWINKVALVQNKKNELLLISPA